MAEKRKRSPNWLPAEKNLLLNIVQKHLPIIENKRIDGVAVKQKTTEWNILTNEYNSQTIHSPRTVETLKSQWECMKKAARKELTKNRMHFMETGGELPSSNTEEPFNKCILDLINPSVVDLHDPLNNNTSDTRADSLDSVSEVGSLDSEDMTHAKVIKVEVPIPAHNHTPVPNPELDWGNHASEERREAKSLHDINMQIKQEELKIKKEELKQSKIKTRLLQLELRLKRRMHFLDAYMNVFIFSLYI